MPEYLHPGVYVEEVPSGAHTIQAASTSTACFIGEAEKGRPFAPTLVTSFPEFAREFGGITRIEGASQQRDMPLAVRHFFENGGTRLFVVRSIDPAATTASGTVDQAFTINAAGPGAWGNQVEVRLTANPLDETRFDLTVVQEAGTPSSGEVILEQFTALGLEADKSKFYATLINRDSDHITVLRDEQTKAFFEGQRCALGLKPDTAQPPGPDQATLKLTGGSDGSRDQALSTAALELATSSIDRNNEISILAAPGITDKDRVEQLVNYADARPARDLILIVDGVGDQRGTAGDDAVAQVQSQLAAITNKTSYAALYWPWIEVPDPYTSVTGATRFAPPSGFIAGLYARTDNNRGVWKAPAGTEAALMGAVGLAMNISDSQQDQLNPVGINVIRQFAASGIVCWGARTLASQTDPEYRYVPIRRLAILLRKSLYRGTQWVVFEPNDEPLWSDIRFNINAFMTVLFRQGAFQGGKPEEAYFVQCDASNNIQATIDAGQVNVTIGFSPLKPAEFVIIQLQQVRKDS